MEPTHFFIQYSATSG